MATFTCAGKEYKIPEMNFLAVERAWPFVQKATEEFDPMKGSSAAIGVVAAALMEGEGFDRSEWDIDAEETDDNAFLKLMHTIKKRLKVSEIGNAKTTMFQILEEGGLQVTEGELLVALQALQEESGGESSQETAPDTLPNSSPPE